MKAFVLVKVASGLEKEPLKAILAIPSLEDIPFLFGEFDSILHDRVP